MVASLKVLINIFIAPSEAFKELKAEPRWLVAFIMISLVLIGATWTIMPFSQQMTHAKMLSSGMDETQIEKAQAIADKFSYIGLLFPPLFSLLKWLFFAGLLYLGVQLLKADELRFKTVYVTVVHAELILVFSALINAILLLYFKDVNDVQHVIDLQAIPGLHLLFASQADNIPLLTFLSNINIFSIWYLAVLTLGVAIVANLRKIKAGVLVTTVWLLSVVFQVAATTFQ